jgi:hypothetical protein
MSRKAIFGLALAVVLMSGPFLGAQANVSEACWAGFCSAQDSEQYRENRDMDKPDATCPATNRQSLTTPEPMGSPGF